MADQKKTAIEGVEVYRTRNDFCGEDLRNVAKIVALCEHLPVVQREGDALVLYAIRPGLIRTAKREVSRRG